MARQNINLGQEPSGEGGDLLRDAFAKVNSMTQELYDSDNELESEIGEKASQVDLAALGDVVAEKASQVDLAALGDVVAEKANQVDLVALGGVVANKVDKVPGLGLSQANYTQDEKVKLGGIASEATKNATDAQLRDRTTHTGMQGMPTISGLAEALAGKLTPADAQSSPADSTAGKLLKVGAFGLGAPLNLVSPNLSQVRAPGFYYCNSPTNGPGGNGYLSVHGADDNYQVHYFESVGDRHQYSRQIIAGIPSTWRKESVTYGSNANGEWWQLPSGLQICVMPAVSAVTEGGLGASTLVAQRVFPVPFIGAPALSDYVTGGGSDSVKTGYITLTATGVAQYVSPVTTMAYSVPVVVGLMAFGRWF